MFTRHGFSKQQSEHQISEEKDKEVAEETPADITSCLQTSGNLPCGGRDTLFQMFSLFLQMFTLVCRLFVSEGAAGQFDSKTYRLSARLHRPRVFAAALQRRWKQLPL